MRETVQFVPLSEIQSERVNISLGLPEWLNQNLIGVNLKGIGTICNLSGLRTVNIVGATDKKAYSESPQVTGFNEQGSAYAAKSQAANFISPSEGSFSYDPYQTLLPRYARWADATVEVNMNEITRMTQAMGSLRNPRDWVNPLNTAISKGLFEAGNKHLSEKMDPEEKAFFWGPATLITASAYLQAPELASLLPAILIGLPLGAIVKHVVDYLRYRVERNQPGVIDYGYRWSIYPHQPEDRQAVLVSLISGTTFIKNLDRS